jgi:hypothetical protein
VIGVVDESNEQLVPHGAHSAAMGVLLTGAIAVLWFVVSWAVFDSPVIDALGEAFGGVAVLLVVVSIVGAVRTR